MAEAPAAPAAAPVAPAAPAAAPVSDAKGLLDDAKPTPDDKTPADPNASTIDTGVDFGSSKKAADLTQKNERPAYIPEKFWDKEKGEPLTEQMAKSYAEMEKNFKLGKHKPPDGGKYETAALTDKGIPADDPLLTEFTGWAAKHGLSQAAYDELAGKVVEMAGGAANEVQLSQKAEMAALGEAGPALVQSMTAWAQSFVAKGVWTVDDFEEYKIMGGTAKGMLALKRIRESYEGRIPLKDTVPTDIGISDEELNARVGHEDYMTNKNGYRDKTEKLFEMRYGNAGGRAA